MSDQETPELIKELSSFCKCYQKLDTGEYVISHEYIRGLRRVINIYPDDRVMVSNDRHDYTVGMHKSKFMDYFYDCFKQTMKNNIDTVIQNIVRHHVDRISIKVKPFGITRTDVKLVSTLDEAFEKGMYSIKLSIMVYDNWWLFKKIRQTDTVIVGFSKDNIYITVTDQSRTADLDTYGYCESISNVDTLISELILLDNNKYVVDL